MVFDHAYGFIVSPVVEFHSLILFRGYVTILGILVILNCYFSLLLFYMCNFCGFFVVVVKLSTFLERQPRPNLINKQNKNV